MEAVKKIDELFVTSLKVGTRMSFGIYDDKSLPQVMNLEEYVALFHIANLYMSEMYEIAVRIIETQLEKLNLCTSLFHCNLGRFSALCKQSIFFEKFNHYLNSTNPNKPTKAELSKDF